MRALLQRCARAAITINGEAGATIGPGLVVLLGIEVRDDEQDVPRLAGKITRLRIFNDENGKMNRSLMDVAGDLLLVSQFTLHADARKGNRPSYTGAARPEQAIPLYEAMISALEAELGTPIATGRFGADMQIDLTNDGPVTILLDTREA